ncbi:MAG: hypothetical protein ABT01_01560 [Clostridium sp. SCN 57-10]|nr:MAG: hypothetical protein ABT01_01560 [Clostridium sp. SCN 57-10]
MNGIASVAATVAAVMGLPAVKHTAPENGEVCALARERFQGQNADRVLLYNPDAVALWLYAKYGALFDGALRVSDLAMPMMSVMPSVTPVCFASMYTGLAPIDHGIQSYTKPVLRVPTLFDALLAAGKRVALVSTAGDSISMIFLERKMDYYIYDTVDEVNRKAHELVRNDAHDVIVVYNGNYDTTMHKFGPESDEAMAQLRRNIDDYAALVEAAKVHWAAHNVCYGFLPDHGCHEIDGGCGSHGLDMPEDMNVIHFYGFLAAQPR